MSQCESEEATELLKTIGDFERISDHAVNVLESAEELRDKGLAFSGTAQEEYGVLAGAVREILHLAINAFAAGDSAAAAQVEPLEEVIDKLKEQMRTRHILRMQRGACSIEAGFVWSDLRPLLEHRGLRAGRSAAQPEPARDAAHRPPRGCGFPNPPRRRRGEVPSPRPGGVKRIPFTRRKEGNPFSAGEVFV